MRLPMPSDARGARTERFGGRVVYAFCLAYAIMPAEPPLPRAKRKMRAQEAALERTGPWRLRKDPFFGCEGFGRSARKRGVCGEARRSRKQGLEIGFRFQT